MHLLPRASHWIGCREFLLLQDSQRYIWTGRPDLQQSYSAYLIKDQMCVKDRDLLKSEMVDACSRGCKDTLYLTQAQSVALFHEDPIKWDLFTSFLERIFHLGVEADSPDYKVDELKYYLVMNYKHINIAKHSDAHSFWEIIDVLWPLSLALILTCYIFGNWWNSLIIILNTGIVLDFKEMDTDDDVVPFLIVTFG